MKIRTQHVYPPIPVRNMDWTAVDVDTYDGPGSPIGYGATEQEAIEDLLEQLEDGTPLEFEDEARENFEGDDAYARDVGVPRQGEL